MKIAGGAEQGGGPRFRLIWVLFGRDLPPEKVNLDLGFTVNLRSIMDLPANYLANASTLDPCRVIFVGMARFALGSHISLNLTDTRTHMSGKNTGLVLRARV